MAEEHRCQAPEGHHPCVNNCGFLGSPATMNLCSKCYRDFRLKEQQQASSTKLSISTSTSTSTSPSSSSSSTAVESVSQVPLLTLPEVKGALAVAIAPAAEQQQQQTNRCMVCRKRVGLTGFKCRCGITFCGSHRYPENHGCKFDFKKAGREEIARANPLIKAEKLVKI
ncbi:hypothetical protein GQ457_01G015470 [Hibiscus cannabinus]